MNFPKPHLVSTGTGVWTHHHITPEPRGIMKGGGLWDQLEMDWKKALYMRQQKRHWCIEQSFGLCGRGRGWNDLGEWHWNTYNIIYETSRQSRFDAWYWMLEAGALGWPRGMVWGGRREEGSGWGTHVYLWRIHFDIWQNQYNIVKLKNFKKLPSHKLFLNTFQSICKLKNGLKKYIT